VSYAHITHYEISLHVVEGHMKFYSGVEDVLIYIKLIVYLPTLQCYPGEDDLAIARAVLM